MRSAVLLLAACGDPELAPDAGLADAASACVATYTGNLTEVATSAVACATIQSGALHAIAPSQLLDAPLEIAIELGTASAGDFASATVAAWSANGVRTVAHSPCAFSAGSAAAPHGDFALALDAQLHGTLTLHAYVLAPEFTDCGDPTTQTVVLAF